MPHALAAKSPRAQLEPFEFTYHPLHPEQVEIAVEYCGICHSDLSMIDNDWGRTKYPFVPGHEAIGKIVAVGDEVKSVQIGQRAGLGWMAGSCMHCHPCMAGDHNLCENGEETIVGRHGGFATRVRCHWAWAIGLPDSLSSEKAGPLFCGGITVFNPIVQCGIKPTDRVGVIGIGGLGHIALQFLDKWGCEVTAFTSSDSKGDEARKMGADHVVNSRNASALKSVAGSFDFILSTVNVPLDWAAYIAALAPKGRFHTVGAVLDPIQISAFSLIGGQKAISGSPLGSPSTIYKMLDFCARHDIAPVTELFPMSKANEALAHLREGKARYRIVLQNDLK